MPVVSVLAFLAAGEGLLRALNVEPPEKREEIFSGFEGAPPLFYKTRSGSIPVYRTSPNRLEYFNPQEFPAAKPVGSLRIFALGGSTTFGEPWGDRGSFAHFLEARLSAIDPSRPIQVVNAGGKGYGSTAVVRLVEEVLRYEPDALLLYTGQNEFREAAFHPLEREGRSSIPAWRAFLHRHSRIYVSLRAALRRFLPAARGARPTSFAAREIAQILAKPFGPESFTFPSRLGIPPISTSPPDEPAIMGRFEQNLRTIFRMAQERGVPCIVLAQLRNEQYWLAPNRSRLRPGAEAEYQRRYVRLLDATASGRIEEALMLVDSVAALYDEDRDTYLHVLEGDLHLSLRHVDSARDAYRSSWGPDPLNERLRAAARGSARLVECDRAARAAAPDSILSFAVFYDEIHPTPAVHRALAEAVLPELEAAGLIPKGAHGSAASTEKMPDQPDAEVLAYESLRALYLGRWPDAEAFAENAAALSPDLGKAQVYVGICAVRRGDLARAHRAWDRLAQLYPELLPARSADR